MQKLIQVKLKIDVDSIDENYLNDLTQEQLDEISNILKNQSNKLLLSIDTSSMDIELISINNDLIIKDSTLELLNGYVNKGKE